MAFFCTLVLAGAAMGFAQVAMAARQGEFFPDGQTDKLSITARFESLARQMAQSPRLNAAAAKLRPVFTAAVPRAARLAAHWAAVLDRWREQIGRQRLEEDFFQNAGLI